MKKEGISGFPEWLPEERALELEILDTLRATFESFGFCSIETSAVERLTVLEAKGVESKEIFAVQRRGAEPGEEPTLGLHFDLTVPFARYTSQFSHELDFPFKRYQIQKVWRGERPQKGRSREFYQFDIDVIGRGSLPISADAEAIEAYLTALTRIPIPKFELRLNNRKILHGLYLALGIAEQTAPDVIRIVDKIDKKGREAVLAELSEIIEPESAEKVMQSTLVRGPLRETAQLISQLNLQHELINEGMGELETIARLLPTELLSFCLCDLSLARGLDYYSGVIFETLLPEYTEFGSAGSGGRYENLAEQFGKQQLPGVGASVGVTRLMELLVSIGRAKGLRKSPSRVLVTVLNDEQRERCNDVARRLRSLGIPAEVFLASPKLGKQIDYAAKKLIPFCVFLDETGDSLRFKDILSGDQQEFQSTEKFFSDVLSLVTKKET